MALVSASLDEIAWMYNIRGSDVPCNQVSVAYAVVTGTNAWLFIDEAKVPTETVKYLTQVSKFDPVFIVLPLPCADYAHSYSRVHKDRHPTESVS